MKHKIEIVKGVTILLKSIYHSNFIKHLSLDSNIDFLDLYINQQLEYNFLFLD